MDPLHDTATVIVNWNAICSVFLVNCIVVRYYDVGSDVDSFVTAIN